MTTQSHPFFRASCCAAWACAAVLAVGTVQAQSAGAAAAFEGRPAMAGAQGGTGAQAGMAQGGLGVQGNESGRGLVLRKPSGLDSMPAVPRDPGMDQPSVGGLKVKPQGDDSGIVKQERSGSAKVKRATRRAAEDKRVRGGERPSE